MNDHPTFLSHDQNIDVTIELMPLPFSFNLLFAIIA